MRARLGVLAGLCVALALSLPGCASRAPSRPRPAAAGRPASTDIPASTEKPGWIEEGVASWYGGNDGFEGKPTASGEIYDSSRLTAAHRLLPLGTVLDVTNVENDRTVRVRINDRGPFVKGRIIDLSRAAARELGILGPGTGTVRLSIVRAGVESAPVSPSGTWAVQVGSFAERPRAERHAERIRTTGRTVYLEPYLGLSRVKVGPFATRQEAEEALGALEQQGFEGIVAPGGDARVPGSGD